MAQNKSFQNSHKSDPEAKSKGVGKPTGVYSPPNTSGDVLAANRRPTVSIVMAVHNGQTYLRRAVESVIGQTFKDFEFIIIDDGSEDESAAVLREFSIRDARIKVQYCSRRGLTRSLNYGVQIANADFIARMDADDVCAPTRFATQVAWLRTNPGYTALGSRAMRIDPDGWRIGEWSVPLEHDLIDQLHLGGRGGGIIHPTAMIRRESLLEVGGYDETLSVAQDYDLWLKLAEIGRLANLPDVLLDYRLHLQSTTFARRVEQNRCLKAALSKAVARRGIQIEAKPTPRLARAYGPAKARREWIIAALRGNHPRTALKHARIQVGENRFCLVPWGLLIYSRFVCWRVGREQVHLKNR